MMVTVIISSMRVKPRLKRKDDFMVLPLTFSSMISRQLPRRACTPDP